MCESVLDYEGKIRKRRGVLEKLCCPKGVCSRRFLDINEIHRLSVFGIYTNVTNKTDKRTISDVYHFTGKI